MCDYSNESYWAVFFLTCWVRFSMFYKMKFEFYFLILTVGTSKEDRDKALHWVWQTLKFAKGGLGGFILALLGSFAVSVKESY